MPAAANMGYLRQYVLFWLTLALGTSSPSYASFSGPNGCSGAFFSSVGTGRTLHYRADFDLRNSDGSPASVESVILAVRRWVERKHPEEVDSAGFSISTRELMTGGSWNLYNLDATLNAKRFPKAQKETPESWALRYQHRDYRARGRWWETNIGIQRKMDGTISFRISTEYWTTAEYLGFDPSPPERSTPGIVRALLNPRYWQASEGSMVIRDLPYIVEVGDGITLSNAIQNKERRLPIVYLTMDPHSGDYLVDPFVLAKVLQGSAVVFAQSPTADAREFDQEMQYLIPHAYRTWGGAARIYHVGADVSNESLALRHPVYSRQTFERLPLELQEGFAFVLVQNVMRAHADMKGSISGQIERLEDVVDAEQKARSVRTAEEASRLRRQLLKLAEQEQVPGEANTDHKKIAEEMMDLAARLESENIAKTNIIGQLETEITELKSRIAWLEYRIASGGASTEAVSEVRGPTEGFIDTFADPLLEKVFRKVPYDEVRSKKDYQKDVAKIGNFAWSRYARLVIERLHRLDSIASLRDLNGKLKRYNAPSKYAGYYGIEVDHQFRVIFKTDATSGRAIDVFIEDYHAE